MAYNLNAPTTQLPALRGLAPVAVAPSQFQQSVPNLAALAQYTPVALQPLAGWSVPSSHPEYKMQGIASGISSLGSGIAQGIQAIYQAKKEKTAKEEAQTEKLRVEGREERLLKDKYEHEEKIAGIRKKLGGRSGGGYYVDQPSATPPSSEQASNSEDRIVNEVQGGIAYDQYGNPIDVNEYGQIKDPKGLISSDPNQLTPDDGKVIEERNNKVLPANSPFRTHSILENLNPVKPSFKANTASNTLSPEQTAAQSQIAALSSVPSPVIAANVSSPVINSPVDVPAATSNLFAEPDASSAFRSNPLADLKSIYDKAAKFVEAEKNSRKEYIAGQSTPNTLENLVNAFSQPKEQSSFGGRFVNIAPPVVNGSPMQPIPAGTAPSVIQAPEDTESRRIAELMREATHRPIAELAPFVAASTESGPAGMQPLPVNQSIPDYNPFTGGVFTNLPPPPEGRQIQAGTPVTANPPVAGKQQTYNIGYNPTPENVASIQQQAAANDRPVTGPFKSIEAAQKEASKHYVGFEPQGNVKWSRLDGGYIVERPPIKQYRLAQIDKANMAGLAYQNEQYNKDQDVTKIRSQHRLLNGFMSAYNSSKENPATQNITDLDMIDNYIAFARGAGSITGGGVAVTENQYNEIKHGKSIPLAVKKAIESVFNGNYLTQPERDTMMKTMMESYNNQARIVNKGTRQMRESMKYTNRNLPEALMPHEYPILRTDTEIQREKAIMMKHADQLEKEIQRLPVGSQQHKDKSSEYENLLNNLRSLGKESAVIRQNNGLPMNIDELDEQSLDKSAGWRQGLFPKGSIIGGDYEGSSNEGQ